jgi:hypothetical protein
MAGCLRVWTALEVSETMFGAGLGARRASQPRI